jgi:hypothetical protein
MPSIGDRLRILVEWSPVVSLAQAVSAAKTNQEKTLAIINVLEFLSSKTPVRFDDELLAKFEAILLTPQGAALVDWLASLLVEMMDTEANMARIEGYEDA